MKSEEVAQQIIKGQQKIFLEGRDGVLKEAEIQPSLFILNQNGEE